MSEFIKRYWKIGLCFLGVFLAGSIAGSGITAGVVYHRLLKRANAANWNEMAMRTLERNLSLTPDQIQKIEPMVGDAVRDLRVIRRERFTESVQVLSRCRTNISTVLDPAQQQKFDALIARRQERLRDFFPR